MQAPAEAAQAQEAEEEGLVLLRRVRELEDETDKLRLDIQRLRSNQSFGYVRGRGMIQPKSGMVLPPKPVIPALDIPPVAAQMPDG